MTETNIISLIAGSTAAGAVAVAIINALFSKNKNSAETRKVELTGSIEVGKMGLEYAAAFKKDLDSLHEKVRVLEDQHETLKVDHEELKKDYDSLKEAHNSLLEKCNHLEEENIELRDRLTEYENK